MSSSISSSDGAPDPQAAPRWRRFIVQAMAAMAGFSLVTVLVHKQGTTEPGGRIGDVSRIHDEAYDAAIFGNSHIMTLNTARLSAATGLDFAMLAIQGMGVPEQMTLLDAYLARHSTPKGLVIAVDWVFCLDDPRVHPIVPFPDWLYSRNPLLYVATLFQTHTFDVAARRIKYLLGREKPQVRDGTLDIFKGLHRTPEQAAKMITETPPEDFRSERNMPAFGMLAQVLDRVPPQTRVVLVLPPVAAAWQPPAGSPADASVQACKAKAFDLAKGRPNVRVVDWHKVTPETEDLGNFWDPSHYYDGLAARVEQDIANAFREMGLKPG